MKHPTESDDSAGTPPPDLGGEGPAAPEETGIDELLDQLEKAMARLADGSLPLDELVKADEEQWRILDRVQARLRELLAKLEADAREADGEGQT